MVTFPSSRHPDEELISNGYHTFVVDKSNSSRSVFMSNELALCEDDLERIIGFGEWGIAFVVLVKAGTDAIHLILKNNNKMLDISLDYEINALSEYQVISPEYTHISIGRGEYAIGGLSASKEKKIFTPPKFDAFSVYASAGRSSYALLAEYKKQAVASLNI